jgi:Kef-type K+ transport system membrane component KefB
MPDQARDEPIFLLIISALVLLSILTKWGAQRYLRVPPVVGFIALGGGLRAAQNQWHFFPETGEWTLTILGELGVAVLLFQVGLKSDIRGLLRELPRAARVWVFDVLASASCAFAVAIASGLSWMTAVFVASALSATSVSISAVIWEDTERLQSKLGRLLVDVAELDDLSAVILWLICLAVVPIARDGGAGGEMVEAGLKASGWLLGKVVLFGAACWVFARYVERRFTAWVARAARPPELVLTILGAGFAAAGVAGAIGFSVAVGALFAGLMFSRDARAVQQQAHLAPLHGLLAPFFFIDVGFDLNTSEIGTSLTLGLLLFVPAVLGKLLGVGLPVARFFGWRAGAVMGASMLPRAEIALLVAGIGNRMGDWAVPDVVYGGLVCAAGMSAIASPLLLEGLFRRWPEVHESPLRNT